MYSFLYMLEFALTALTLGLSCVALPRILPLPLFSRFCFGAGLTPFFFAGLTALMAMIAPGAKAEWFVLAPLAIVLPMLFALLRSAPFLMPSVTRHIVRFLSLGHRDRWPMLLLICCLGVAGFVGYIGFLNADRPVIGHDALIYLSEGKAFAETRNLSALRTGMGEPGLLPATHPHSAAFSLFLGQALLFSPDAPGYPGDGAARAAFQMTAALLVLAMAGLAALSRKRGAAGLAFLTFFLFPAFEYLSSTQSRDAFRLIPLLLLIGSLIGLLMRRGWPLRMNVPPALAAMLSIYGHTLGLYFLGLIGLWFLAAAAILRVSRRSLVSLALTAGLFCLAPLAHYVRSWLEKGNILGEGMNYFFFKDTPLMDAFLASSLWGKAQLPFLEAVLAVIRAQSLAAGGLAAAAAIMLAVLAFRPQTPRRMRILSLSLAALALMFLLVPLSNVLRSFTIDMKEAYLSNFRYPFTFFVLCAPLIAWAVLGLARAVGQQADSVVVSASLLGLAFAASVVLQGWPRYEDPKPVLDVVAADREVCALANAMPGRLWLTDRYTASYYCNRRPVFLYTAFGRRFFAAQTREEASRLLQSEKAGLVSLSLGDPDWWPRTMFYQELEEQAERRKILYWDTFIVKP